MNVCIIGSGPSGLYLSKYLSPYVNKIVLFEKERIHGGNYKYSPTVNFKIFDNILKLQNVELRTNNFVNSINFKDIENSCDIFVLATGGEPIKDSNSDILTAIEILKDNDTKSKLGNNLCILGMGNVSFDLAKILFKDKKHITIFSRYNLIKSPFTTSGVRDLISRNDIQINIKNDNSIPTNILQSRKLVLLKSVSNQPKENCDRQLTLKLNTQVRNVSKKDGKYKVEYENGEVQLFDNVISSYGFKPLKLKLDTHKSVYSLGWCVKAGGNLSNALFEAKTLAKKIIDDVIKK